MKQNGRGLWRWLWWWLSVLMAGCAARSGGNVAPASALPLATMPRPILTLPTLTPIWRVIRPLPATTTPGSASMSTSARPSDPPAHPPNTAVMSGSPPVTAAAPIRPPALTLEPLACYRSAPAGLWCLGAILNSLTIPYAGLTVRVTLLDGHQAALMAQTVPTARPLLRPSEETPYGVLFPTVPDAPDSIGGATVELVSALPVSITNSTDPIALPVSDLTIRADGQISAVVHNRSPHDALMTTTATLFASDNRVLGYHQIADPTLLHSGDTRLINTAVMPLTANSKIARAVLSADGFSGAN